MMILLNNYINHYLDQIFSIFYRCFISFFFAFFFSLFLILNLLKILKKLKVYQSIKLTVPSSHLNKSNTPTMGGVAVICTIIITIIIFSDLSNKYIWYVLYLLFFYSIIGFIDDYLKIFGKKKIGLSIINKYTLLSIVAIFIIIVMYKNNFNEIRNYYKIIFFNNSDIIKDISFFILSYFIIVGFSNAANLTDGLDGLLIFPIILTTIGIGFLTFLKSNLYLHNYFNLNYLFNIHELLIVCSAIFGSSLGFLWFNIYPAKIFMGDVGSLPLGGVIGMMAIIISEKLFFIIIGGLFIIETFSVIIQVIFFKITKKKIFLMSPIHHHYEIKGYKEQYIVIRFWIISIMLLMLGYFVKYFLNS